MSTSLLVEKMKQAAPDKGIDLTISARSVDDISENIADVNVILLGPQVRFKQKQVEKLVNKKIPVGVIDMSAYGTMNGERVMEHAISILGL